MWILSRGTTGNLLMLGLLYTNCRRYLIGCHVCLSVRSEVAILYNDRSVLENYHVSAAYRLMAEEDMNILVNLNKDDWRFALTAVAWCLCFHLNAPKALTLSFDITTTYKTPLCVLCVDVQNSFSKRQWKGYFKILTVLMIFTEFPADSVKIRWLKIF